MKKLLTMAMATVMSISCIGLSAYRIIYITIVE